MPNYIRWYGAKDSSPVPTASLNTLRRLVREQIRAWQPKRLKPLQHASDIFDCPHRILRLSLMEGIVERPEVFLDKPTGEFLEFKARGVDLYNRMSMAGVEHVVITREGWNWAKTKLSGRALAPSHVIK